MTGVQTCALPICAVPVPAVLPLLRDPHSRVRCAAAAALGASGSGEAVAPLVACLEDHEYPVRAAAAQALAELKALEAIPALIDLLDDPVVSVRSNAVTALQSLRATEAVPALLKRLRVEASTLIRGILAALSALDAKEAIPDVACALDETDSFQRHAAAGCLCALGDRRGAPLVLAQLDRLNALNALRNPRLWQRLAGSKVEKDFKGTRRVLLERAARAIGLPIEWSDSLNDQDRDSLDGQIEIPTCGGRATYLDALRTAYGPYVVLEDDRVRVISIDHASGFWKSWWEKEGRK